MLDAHRLLFGLAALLVAAAAAVAGQCPGAGDCCSANGSPGCADASCCDLVCGQDAFCCQVEWDRLCADAACAQCQVCQCFPACDLACAAGADQEAETCGADTNGGCNSTPPQFASIADGQVVCGTAWSGGGQRDTDWFAIETPDASTGLTAAFNAEFGGLCYVISGIDACEPVVIGEIGAAAGCVPEAPAQAIVPPGAYAIFVATSGFEGTPCGDGNAWQVEMTARCTGDTNDDGVVDVTDLITVIFLWGTPGAAGGVNADVTQDEWVDVKDIVSVIAYWGPCAG